MLLLSAAYYPFLYSPDSTASLRKREHAVSSVCELRLLTTSCYCRYFPNSPRTNTIADDEGTAEPETTATGVGCETDAPSLNGKESLAGKEYLTGVSRVVAGRSLARW